MVKIKIFYLLFINELYSLIFTDLNDECLSSIINVSNKINNKTKEQISNLTELINFLENNESELISNEYLIKFYPFNEDILSIKDYLDIYISQQCHKGISNNYNINEDESYIILLYDLINIQKSYFLILDIENSICIDSSFDFTFCSADPIIFSNRMDIKNNFLNVDIRNILYAKEFNIDLFNFQTDFFKNICFNFSSYEGIDVPLEIRKNDYFQKITLCDINKGAYYLDFELDIENNEIKFKCIYGFFHSIEKQNEFISNYQKEIDSINYSYFNFKIIKCFEKFFLFRNYKNNYDGIILICITIIQIFLFIIFCIIGVSPIEKKIKKELSVRQEKLKKSVSINKKNIQQKNSNSKGDSRYRLSEQIPDRRNFEFLNLRRCNKKEDKKEDRKEDKKEDKKKGIKNALNLYSHNNLIIGYNLNKEENSNQVNNSSTKQIIINSSQKKGQNKYLKKKSKKMVNKKSDDRKRIKNNNPPVKKARKKKVKFKKENNENNGNKINNNMQKENNFIIECINNDKYINNVNNVNSNYIEYNSQMEMKQVETKNQNIKIKTIKNISEKKNISEYEINELSFISSKKYDKRTFAQVYFSIIKQNHLLLNTFFNFNDYELIYNKISLLIIQVSICFFFNTLFFSNKQIKNIYHNKKENKLAFHFGILKAFFVSIFASFILDLLKFVCLSNKAIIIILKEKDLQKANDFISLYLKNKKIKLYIYYILSLLFLFLSIYYVVIFCSIFINSQLYLFLDSFISCIMIFMYPLFISIFISLFRVISIKRDNLYYFKIYYFLKIL